MLDIAVLAGICLSFASVLLVFGCICQLFKKSSHEFSTFENDVEAGHGQGLSIFSTQNAVAETSEVSQVTFEPLPDILAKTVSATALRPRISSIEKEQQRISAKHITVYRPFPRSNLLYVKEIGIGWFGQVLLGDAEKINVNSKKTRVVVKLLKDDATSSEQQLFLEEVAAYREIEHPNVLQLLGQCTESAPFLVILEQAPFGDVKSYLKRCLPERESFIKRGMPLRFIIDMASGLASLHRHDYLHHDFSCRNCLVMSDLSVKVGDYGVAEDHYREDYYDTGQNLLPIRWMAPDTLELQDLIWQVTQFSRESNIWSFGVAIWEVLEFGEKPYHFMSDEEVLQKVIKLKVVGLTTAPSEDQKDLSDLIPICCAGEPPSLEDIHSRLLEIQKNRQDHRASLESEFDSKWEQAPTKVEPKVVNVQKDIPPEPSEAKDVQNMAASPKSHSSLSSPSIVNVIADVHLPPKDHLMKTDLHSAESDSSNIPIVSESTCVSKPVSAVTRPVNVPLKTEEVEDVIMNGHVVEEMEKPSDANSVQTISNERMKEVEKPPVKQMPTDNSVNVEESFDILGGNCDIQVESMTNFQSPLPTLNSPLKIRSSDYLTSTPVEKKEMSDEVLHSEDPEIQMEENQEIEVEMRKKVCDGSESPTGRGRKPVKAMIPRALSDEMEDDESIGRYSAADIDKALDFMNESEGKDSVLEAQNERDSVSSAIEDDIDEEEDKLKLLRMTIASALGQKEDESQVDEGGHSSDTENPFMDDLDIAKEIYRSKGTTIPPTNHTTSRTLNTIPEDGIPVEDNLVETASNANTNSTKSSPIKKALKFNPFDESIFSNSAQDTFEWDDYIGDELVGKVNDDDFQDSPRQSMEFPDWTLEMDASSSSGNESLNHSKPGSEASDSRPGSRASNHLSTSESEVKSPVGLAARSYVKDLLSKKRSSASPSLSSYISDKSSFYALSHNYDLDSSEHVTSDSELSNSPVSISNGDGAFIEEWDLV
ncbi:serine/threonine-protein kinase LMTK2-like isoform X2 [Saccostrea echinata]|uniref:serine/threonine-protein kinase LMTK2-like isoform X2 n=1 Tax=Saccostrea echinata TaxID=191078 RepID=UPI002A81653F|nr:serine/threonine-protein kinase LMTK2-like isoform X2 [Saccostrea echinata]